MSALLLPLTWKCRALMELSRPGVLRIVRRAQQVLLAILQGVSSTSAETGITLWKAMLIATHVQWEGLARTRLWRHTLLVKRVRIVLGTSLPVHSVHLATHVLRHRLYLQCRAPAVLLASARNRLARPAQQVMLVRLLQPILLFLAALDTTQLEDLMFAPCALQDHIALPRDLLR